jgi:hypothetical protein
MRTIQPQMFMTRAPFVTRFRAMSRVGQIGFVVLSSMILAEIGVAIVNGVNAENPSFQAIVSLSNGGCTGTFIHPRFILTAAHCLPKCSGPTAVGCVTGSSEEVFNGTASGRDGTLTSFEATDGTTPGTGMKYSVDFAYFSRSGDIASNRASDAVLLRTTAPFSGKIIPVFSTQDAPRPAEGNYCPRWEYTWPRVSGYSTNAGVVNARRRIGRTFAECDLEMDKTVFKLDGHGRGGQRGIRICKGDSGGPVLWETGFGWYAVGGINSGTDSYRSLHDTHCPSERGEGFHAFVPFALLDRVARVDSLCNGVSRWDACPGLPMPNGGYRLRYIDTTIDQCGEEQLDVLSTQGHPIRIRPGETRAVEVPAHRFGWTCGNSQEWTTAERRTRLVIVKRALTDRQIIWDCYEILGYPTRPTSIRQVEVYLDENIDRCSGALRVKDKNNNWIRVPRGVWTTVDVAIDSGGYWYWRCDGSDERSRGDRNYRWRIKRLKIFHETDGRKIRWKSFDIVSVRQ